MNSEHCVSVHPRRAEDLADAAAALIEVHSTDGYPVEGVADPEAWLSPPQLLKAWVAELEGRVVGHVAISRPDGEEAVRIWTDRAHVPDSQVAVLARLFVVREARGNDVGRWLMAAATASAQMDGLRLVLDVMVKDTAAIRLYERLGWKRIGMAKHAYGDGQSTEAICFVSPEPGEKLVTEAPHGSE
ncbi:GNAT family N-acetyltransferase [Streptomyces violascens]|uniref:GNAT family N-acetyltransferase n=1 Tax=Streptomyces violascens TaxID=67381 RepID=UPI00366530D1